MNTQRLALLDTSWRRPYDRRETPLWLAAIASPAAWVGHLVGVSTLLAVMIIAVAGIVAGVQLRALRRRASRSPQRAWFLAQTGLVLAIVATLLVLLAVAAR